jgi:hypothetical protein
VDTERIATGENRNDPARSNRVRDLLRGGDAAGLPRIVRDRFSYADEDDMTKKPKTKVQKPPMRSQNATHGFLVSKSWPIERSIRVHLFDDGDYQISIATHWPDASKPVVTTTRLSRDAFILLSDAMATAAHDMSRWVLRKGEE